MLFLKYKTEMFKLMQHTKKYVHVNFLFLSKLELCIYGNQRVTIQKAKQYLKQYYKFLVLAK